MKEYLLVLKPRKEQGSLHPVGTPCKNVGMGETLKTTQGLSHIYLFMVVSVGLLEVV